MNTEEKKEFLLKLAEKRKKDRYRYPKYKNLCDYHNGYYECDDYVSPYSRSAHNVDANIMIILKDWTSDEVLKQPINETWKKIGHDPNRPTNKNLKLYMREHFKIGLSDTYATNLFPFIKKNEINSQDIERCDWLYGAKKYAIPQIQCIQPCLVIVLGKDPFNAIRRNFFKRSQWETGKELLKNKNHHFQYTYKDLISRQKVHSEIWFQYHTAQESYGKKINGKEWSEIFKESWDEMGEWFRKNCMRN